MTSSPEDIRRTVADLLPKAERFLIDLMRFPSLPGLERPAMDYLHARLMQLPLELKKVPVPASIVKDEDFSDPIPGIVYGDGRYDLVAVRKGLGGGRRVLINTHIDVVPPSEGMTDAWAPRIIDGKVYGRGACDAKGQAAVLYLLLSALDRLGVRLPGDLEIHFVVEEEVGGNGSLVLTRTAPSADACIVMEPTDANVCASIRGAVWFRLAVRGRAGHSGESSGARSALGLAREAMEILEGYHAKLLASSRGIPLFDKFSNPMPLTFGMLNAGNWPASVPDAAAVEGVLGFLPNKTREEIRREMETILADRLGDAVEFRLTYRHDASVLDQGHPLPRGLSEAARGAGLSGEVTAMTASCDAWLYNNRLKIPTVVFGVGSLGVAHSRDENVALKDVAAAAEALARFLTSASV